MRFIPGLVVAVITVLAFVAYRGLGSHEAAPGRDFLELELAAADRHATGTCYSLSTVLIANTIGYSNATISWQRIDADTWIRRSEELIQSAGGPSHVWASFTFKRVDARIVPVAHDSAPGPVASLASAVDTLLEAPHARRSTRIDRCLNGGTGYEPKP